MNFVPKSCQSMRGEKRVRYTPESRVVSAWGVPMGSAHKLGILRSFLFYMFGVPVSHGALHIKNVWNNYNNCSRMWCPQEIGVNLNITLGSTWKWSRDRGISMLGDSTRSWLRLATSVDISARVHRISFGPVCVCCTCVLLRAMASDSEAMMFVF